MVYTIAMKNTSPDLILEVNKLLLEGYKLQGGVSIHSYGGVFHFAQALYIDLM